MLMMPFLTDQLVARLPSTLKLLDQEDDLNNLQTFIQDMLLKKALCTKYKSGD